MTADSEPLGASIANLFTAQVFTFLLGVAGSFAASLPVTGIVL